MNKATCSVAICQRKHYARGYCQAHYDRVLRTGDPQEWKPIRRLPSHGERDDILTRILGMCTQTPTGCLVWHGRKNHAGYGTISWGARNWQVHRAVWTVVVAPIPKDDDWTIDHLCGTRACVNVGHLEVVTRTENARRGGGLRVAQDVNRERNEARTHCKYGHEFTPENTLKVKAGGRLCRTCNKIRWAAKSAKINAKRKAQRKLSA